MAEIVFEEIYCKYKVKFNSRLAGSRTELGNLDMTEIRNWCRERFGPSNFDRWYDDLYYNNAGFSHLTDAELFRDYIEKLEVWGILKS